MFRRSEKGFTLVELMIVVVIIGILASIAIPKFSSLIGKTKASEAKQILGQIVQQEKTYYFTNNAYEDFNAALADPAADGSTDCPEIGFAQPDMPRRFNYSFTDSVATAVEIEDVNNDGDLTDGLTLSVTQAQGIVSGSNIAW